MFGEARSVTLGNKLRRSRFVHFSLEEIQCIYTYMFVSLKHKHFSFTKYNIHHKEFIFRFCIGIVFRKQKINLKSFDEKKAVEGFLTRNLQPTKANAVEKYFNTLQVHLRYEENTLDVFINGFMYSCN